MLPLILIHLTLMTLVIPLASASENLDKFEYKSLYVREPPNIYPFVTTNGITFIVYVKSPMIKRAGAELFSPENASVRGRFFIEQDEHNGPMVVRVGQINHCYEIMVRTV